MYIRTVCVSVILSWSGADTLTGSGAYTLTGSGADRCRVRRVQSQHKDEEESEKEWIMDEEILRRSGSWESCFEDRTKEQKKRSK